MSEFEDSCLKDSVLHPKHAEVYNSVLSIYHCCQQLFPPRYHEVSLMALTIPASQDTIKSFSPVTVPPPHPPPPSWLWALGWESDLVVYQEFGPSSEKSTDDLLV